MYKLTFLIILFIALGAFSFEPDLYIESGFLRVISYFVFASVFVFLLRWFINDIRNSSNTCKGAGDTPQIEIKRSQHLNKVFNSPISTHVPVIRDVRPNQQRVQYRNLSDRLRENHINQVSL